MAVFNPAIEPTKADAYLSVSKGVPIPENLKPSGVGANSILPKGNTNVDKSSEYAYKALGSGIEDGLKEVEFATNIADNLKKTQLDNSIYTTVDAERNANIATLEAYKAGPMSYQGTEGAPLNLLSGTAASTPQDIVNGVQRAGALQASNAGGHVPNTYYYGRLDADAKALRSANPGYAEYIDSKFSSIAGVNPANAYMTALLADINRQAENNKTAENKTEKLITDNLGFPGSADMYRKWKSKEITDQDVINWVAPRKAQEYQWQVNKSARDDIEGDTKLKQSMSEQDGNKMLVQLAANHIQNVEYATDTHTPQKIFDFITAAQQGSIKPTTEQVQQLGAALSSYRNLAYSDMLKEMQKSGIAQTLGPTKTNAMITENLKSYDMYSDAIYNQNWGLALRTANAVKAYSSDSSYGLISRDDTLGSRLRNISAFQHFGPYAQQFYLTSLGAGYAKDMANFMTSNKEDMLVQPDLRTKGNLSTLMGTIQKAKDAEKQGTVIPQKVYEDLTAFPAKTITDPEVPDELKANVVKATFGPGNGALLSKFVKDGRDPLTGKPVQGRYTVWNRLTSRQFTDEVVRLDKADPSKNLLNDYKSTTEEMFGRDLMGDEISTLRAVQMDPRVKLAWHSDPINPYFELVPKQEKLTPGTPADPYRHSLPEDIKHSEYAKSINRLNMGFPGLVNIAKAVGADPEAYLINVLVNAGYNPVNNNVSDVPSAMLSAIKNSRVRSLLKLDDKGPE